MARMEAKPSNEKPIDVQMFCLFHCTVPVVPCEAKLEFCLFVSTQQPLNDFHLHEE